MEDDSLSRGGDGGAYRADAYNPGDASTPGDAGEPDATTPDATEPDGGETWAWFQLSSDDSTSMATAQLLKQRDMLYRFSLKPHEVLNYYDPPATLREEPHLKGHWRTDDDLFVGMDAERVSVDHGETEALELLVHVHTPQVPEFERRPWILHLCVDVSGSMFGEKIEFTRDALLKLVDAMRPGDKLSLTTFSTNGSVIFETLALDESEAAIRDAISRLEAYGSTNMIEGLGLAYAEAQEVYDPAAINRVLLFSDGNANVGDTDIATFAELTRINNQEGIYLSGVGVGADYAIERMDQLTDAGKGAHVFLPNRAEVDVIFGGMVRKLVEVSADEVAVEVQLPPSFYLQRFSGEEVSTDPNHRVPNVVLAAGDDMTLLATFRTDTPADFGGDMILTLRYRPLSTGEPAVFEKRVAIADLFGSAGTLRARTRLVNDYATWACGRTSQVSPAELRHQILEFTPQDPGLEEIARLMGEMQGEGFRGYDDPCYGGACNGGCDPAYEGDCGSYDAGYPYYDDGYYYNDGPYVPCHCSAFDAPAVGLVPLGLLLGLLALSPRRRG